MYPFINLGPIQIPVYGLLAVVGFALALYVATFSCKLYRFPLMDCAFAAIFAGIGIIVGAKALYVITVLPNLPQWIKDGYSLTEIVMALFAGLVFYGGFIGALVGAFIYCKMYHLHFLGFLNIMVPSIPLFHSIGRLGCFFAGCCYGIEYHGFGAVKFPYNELVPELSEVSRFPVQLFEAGLNFLLFIGLFIYSRKKRKPGSLLGIYLICYAIIRFSLEMLRGDVARGIFFGISTSQWISLLLIPVGVFFILRKEKVSAD
ncbi:MAG: prolipoprotein diacylglyceryl transferase [Lachnospiraceae bacterium]|nr:prolipoprotein diacylglyceryl transferase [Lachnospiraceae bacterium]